MELIVCVTTGGPKTHHPAPCSISRSVAASRLLHCAEFHMHSTSVDARGVLGVPAAMRWRTGTLKPA
jgi:hypothetical protein